jgi:hypothetical protein
VSGLVAVVDAGVASPVNAAIAAASSAGGPAVPAAAPASGGGLLHQIFAAGAGPALIAAVVAIFGWWVNRRLERFKHELAEDIAKRQLRADYVRGQIDNLYGPLAFLVEANARHIEMHKSVFNAYSGFFEGRTWRRPRQSAGFGSRWTRALRNPKSRRGGNVAFLTPRACCDPRSAEIDRRLQTERARLRSVAASASVGLSRRSRHS